jgi:hypothetical protein
MLCVQLTSERHNELWEFTIKGQNHINETVDVWFTPARKITETVFQDHSVKKK